MNIAKKGIWSFIVAGLAVTAAYLGGLLPGFAAAGLVFVAKISTGTALAATAAAAWLREATDDPGERIFGAMVTIFAIAVLIAAAAAAWIYLPLAWKLVLIGLPVFLVVLAVVVERRA